MTVTAIKSPVRSRFDCYLFSDQGFEDTENGVVFHSPMYQGRLPGIPLETQHASLKRKKSEKQEGGQGSPGSEKAHSMNLDLAHRPLSMVVPSQSEASMPVSSSIGSLSRQVSLTLKTKKQNIDGSNVLIFLHRKLRE